MPSGSGSQKKFRRDHVRQVPGAEVRPMVPQKCREKRSHVLLPCLPDEILAGRVNWSVIRWAILCLYRFDGFNT